MAKKKIIQKYIFFLSAINSIKCRLIQCCSINCRSTIPENFAILNVLKWCISHSWSCVFKSVSLFSDSQYVLKTLFDLCIPNKQVLH